MKKILVGLLLACVAASAAQFRIRDLPAIAAVTDDDIFWMVNDPGGVPSDRKVTAQAIGGLFISNAAYDVTWNGVNQIAPSKNAVYDKINSVEGAKQNNLVNSAGLAGALSDETGTGLAVFNNSPVFITPTLGVAGATSVAVGDDAYGVAWNGDTRVPTKNAVYDKINSVEGAKQDTLVNSAGLAAALGDETGTGLAVFNNSPLFITPTLGVAGATSVAVTDDAYAVTWNGDTRVPTKNAVYDKIESLSVTGATNIDYGSAFTYSITNLLRSFGTANAATLTVNDDAYAVGWNGSTNVPTKNAIYDKIESLSVDTNAAYAWSDVHTFSQPVSLLANVTVGGNLEIGGEVAVSEGVFTNSTFLSAPTNDWATGSETLLAVGTDKVSKQITVGSGLTLAGGTLTSSAAFAYDIDNADDTTDETVTSIWTNGVAADTTEFMWAEVTAAGPTNYGAYKVLAVVANHGGSAVVKTNQLVTLESDANLDAYWELSGTNALLRVVGLADENIHWLAKGAIHSTTNAAATGGGGPSYIIEEHAEGAGTPAGWTDTESPNWDYTDLVLAGSESLQLTNSVGTNTVVDLGGNYGELWVYGKIRWTLDPAASYEPITFMDSGSVTRGYASHRSSAGAFRVYNGTAYVSTSGNTAPDTTYHFWAYYKKGTGADGQTFWAVDPTSRPEMTPGNVGSLWGWTTNGQATADISKIQFRCSTTVSVIIDDIYVDDEDITGTPE